MLTEAVFPLQKQCALIWSSCEWNSPTPCRAVCWHSNSVKTSKPPALAALLPKLHLNHQTTQAILFAGYRYGELSLPELYTDQSVGQIKLLAGHLKLQDDNRALILSNLSYLQMYTGSSMPALYLPYSKYAQVGWIYLANNCTPSQLFCINSCRLYLQILMVSDISMANGLCVPREVQRDPDLKGELDY